MIRDRESTLMTTRPERTGRTFERVVCDIVRGAGGVVRCGPYVGPTCFGTPWHVDAVLDNAREYPAGLIVECKWQEADGSSDEKFNHLVANIVGASMSAIVVIGGHGVRQAGSGARPEAIAWLRRQADGRQLVTVLTTEELIVWLRALHFDRRLLF